MPDLIIEYNLDGKHPGYAFRQPTNGYHEDVLKAVWKGAMPRGQGWGANGFTGAQSLKCFPLNRRFIAVSEVIITDQEDEEGRRGIRQAAITLMSPGEYLGWLNARLDAYPLGIQEEAHRRLNLPGWAQIIHRALPRLRGRQPQVVLTSPYRDAYTWQIVEYLSIKLATSWVVKTIKGWGRINSLTTLALTHRDEARIVAIPLEKADQIRDLPVILFN